MTKQTAQVSVPQLQQQKTQVQQEIAQLQQKLQINVDATLDEADPSVQEQNVDHVLLANARRKLEAIDHALEQAQNGQYGICEGCGQPINPQRLEIFPEATLCVACQSKKER